MTLPEHLPASWSGREKLWRAYIQLAQAEAAFRMQKDELSIRPIWHQRADRVEAHIVVCFLAFVLWKTLELWQRRAELGNSPRTVLEEIKRIQCHDVCLPTTTHGEIKLRCVTQLSAVSAIRREAMVSNCCASSSGGHLQRLEAGLSRQQVWTRVILGLALQAPLCGEAGVPSRIVTRRWIT